MSSLDRDAIDDLIEQATVDCYNEEEQATGWYTMITDNLELPFTTTVLGVQVIVHDVDLMDSGDIVAHCSRGAFRQVISMLELPMPTPAPSGADWIMAYRHWRSG